ncbi:hypothetical protein JOC70_000816 [Clostridium pascui]|nr:hypothetical protein [Clostridium pascui]MBM7869347.1 hypothetical protein [Clostridium pascui]
MNNALWFFTYLDPIVTIMAKMAFVFLSYKAMQAMNVYINSKRYDK